VAKVSKLHVVVIFACKLPIAATDTSGFDRSPGSA
jgi:hypothetical protein